MACVCSVKMIMRTIRKSQGPSRMRLTRRIALPTGMEICLSARPLPPDGTGSAPDEAGGESTERIAVAPGTGEPRPAKD